MPNASQTARVAPSGAAEEQVKSKMKKRSILAALVVIASSFVVAAQQPEPSAPSVSAQAPDINTKYLLEIYSLPHFGPTYQMVGGQKYTGGSGYFTRFIRIGEESQSGRLPIRQIKVEPKFDGQIADIRVTLIRGEGANQEEELLHVYQLSPGEQKSMSHMRDVGIEPFKIKLLDAALSLPSTPDFRNFTKSIDIVRVRREMRPMPAYRITVRNRSDKSVSALRVDVTSDGQEGPTALPDGDNGLPLLAPGAETDVYIPVIVSVRNETTYVPATPASNIINIRSVTFTDLSFEGDQDHSCSIQSQTMGERLWLKGIVPFLDQELAKTDFADQLEAAKLLKEKASRLRYTFDETERNMTSPVSPSCQKPAKNATTTARQLNLMLMREVDQFIADNPAPPVTFKAWLEEKHSRYSAWLARLQ